MQITSDMRSPLNQLAALMVALLFSMVTEAHAQSNGGQLIPTPLGVAGRIVEANGSPYIGYAEVVARQDFLAPSGAPVTMYLAEIVMTDVIGAFSCDLGAPTWDPQNAVRVSVTPMLPDGTYRTIGEVGFDPHEARASISRVVAVKTSSIPITYTVRLGTKTLQPAPMVADVLLVDSTQPSMKVEFFEHPLEQAHLYRGQYPGSFLDFPTGVRTPIYGWGIQQQWGAQANLKNDRQLPLTAFNAGQTVDLITTSGAEIEVSVSETSYPDAAWWAYFPEADFVPYNADNSSQEAWDGATLVRCWVLGGTAKGGSDFLHGVQPGNYVFEVWGETPSVDGSPLLVETIAIGSVNQTVVLD